MIIKSTVMDPVKVRRLIFSGIVLTTLSMAVIAQTQSADTTNTHKAKAHKTAQQKPPYAPDSELYNSGSSANVRHDRTGSLNPGHVFGATGTTGVTGTTGPTGGPGPDIQLH